MTIVIAHVDWPEGAPNPTVNPDNLNLVGKPKNTVVRWYASERVLYFSVGGLSPTQFGPAESPPNVISFSTTDTNTDGQLHDYMVTAVNVSGEIGTIDPKIQNGVQPPPTSEP